MDRDHFDNLTRALTAQSSRRGFGGLLLALGLGTSSGLQIFDSNETAARKRRRRKKRKNKNRDKPGTCQPDCAGKDCGPDGCGGSCGTCIAPLLCAESTGQCVEDDGLCGSCPPPGKCHGGACCDPNCYGQVCGFSACGGSCGTCPLDQPLCIDFGYACVPIPDLP